MRGANLPCGQVLRLLLQLYLQGWSWSIMAMMSELLNYQELAQELSVSEVQMESIVCDG